MTLKAFSLFLKKRHLSASKQETQPDDKAVDGWQQTFNGDHSDNSGKQSFRPI